MLYFALQELSMMGFCEVVLDVTTTALKIVDDNGNVWGCTLIYDNTNYAHFKFGGGWKRMVLARNLRPGSRILLGAPSAGKNETLYLCVIRK
jgi:hypothetical protein